MTTKTKKSTIGQKKAARIEKVNKAIAAIANCGHNNCVFNGKISYFSIIPQGTIFYNDAFTNEAVYIYDNGGWKGFSDREYIRPIIEALRDYVRYGYRIYPYIIEGLARYGYENDISTIIATIKKLGILEECGN